MHAVQNVATGLAMPLPVMSKAEPWIGSNIDGNRALGVEVGRGRDAERAGQRRREIGQNVGVQVGGDDRVERLGLACVMRMVIASTSILSQVTSGNSCATSAAISSHITMPWRCALDLVTTVRSLRGRELRQLEREAHDPGDAGAGEDRHLGRDLLRQAAMRAAALAGILAFGILAHDHPVELRPWSRCATGW